MILSQYLLSVCGMKKLTSYIFGQLFFTVIAIILVLSSIMWLVQSLRYVELISNKGIPVLLFLKMLIYLFPNIFVITIPIAILLGILFIYNKLITDHELVVMQAAGVSQRQLIRPVLLLAGVFTVLLYFLTLYFLPFSFRKHRDMILLLKQESLTSLISDGQFSTFKTYTVYAHRKDNKGQFFGVLLFDASQADKSVFFMAEKGILVNKGSGGYLLLINGSRQEQDLNTSKPSILYFDRYVIDPKNTAFENKQEIRLLKAYERGTGELLNPTKPLDPVMQRDFEVAAHQRLIFPLYALVFGCLGASVLLLGYFNRKGRAGRIILACSIALLIEVIEMILFHGWAYGNFIMWICYGVVFIPLFVCLYLLFSGGASLSQLFNEWRKP